jgi:hypothetical protein
VLPGGKGVGRQNLFESRGELSEEDRTFPGDSGSAPLGFVSRAYYEQEDAADQS